MISSLLNNEIEMILKEAVVVYFYLLAQYLPGWS